MLSRMVVRVRSVDDTKLDDFGMQIVRSDCGEAISYVELAGTVEPGDQVLLNRTARDLSLGTGGYDFVIARLATDQKTPAADRSGGHAMRLRYTPLQHSVRLCEEDENFAAIAELPLDGFPVVACELHSQIAPVAAALDLSRAPCTYVMTDSACLAFGLSDLAGKLLENGLFQEAFAVGQAFGGNGVLHAVTVHDALIAAKHRSKASAAIVCQGPGNTGCNTKYGFSGITQAADLDAIAALGGTPIACVRASNADKRTRHQGISHHTQTVLELVRSRCIVPLPEGLEAPAEWSSRHDVRFVPHSKTQAAVERLAQRGINVTTMGRAVEEDPLFFHAAAAAGVIAAKLTKGHQL